MTVVPGLCGFVFTVALCVCLFLGRDDAHKGKINIKLIAFLSLVYHLLDTLPICVLYTSMVCPNDSIVGKGETWFCFLSKGSVHLIQMQLYL
jgi:hypothetical protein